MAKEVKNPGQLTKFEEHFVDLYVMNWTAFYYILRTKYAGPKEFAEKLIIKITMSKSKTAENFLFMYGYREQSGIYSPTELNKILKKELGGYREIFKRAALSKRFTVGNTQDSKITCTVCNNKKNH